MDGRIADDESNKVKDEVCSDHHQEDDRADEGSFGGDWFVFGNWDEGEDVDHLPAGEQWVQFLSSEQAFPGDQVLFVAVRHYY